MKRAKEIKAKDKKNKILTWKQSHSTLLKVRFMRIDNYRIYVTLRMTILELKAHLELVTGIPVFLQKLSYIDQADLLDDTTLKENLIMPKTEINLDVWFIWRDFINIAIEGDPQKVLSYGTTLEKEIEYHHSKYINLLPEETKISWLQLRGFIGLCIGAHHGWVNLCKELIDHGANPKRKTALGRNCLHLAAAHGQLEVISVFVDNGVLVQDRDSFGQTPIDIAILFGKSGVERFLIAVEPKLTYRKKSLPTLKQENTNPETKSTEGSRMSSIPASNLSLIDPLNQNLGEKELPKSTSDTKDLEVALPTIKEPSQN
ncbi:neurofilament medium polypeptide-like isoform X1 [Argonauta hians]